MSDDINNIKDSSVIQYEDIVSPFTKEDTEVLEIFGCSCGATEFAITVQGEVFCAECGSTATELKVEYLGD